MKIAHLILTHKNPEQLERLIKAMDHPAFDFYVHIDKKTNAAPFQYLAEKKNIFLIKNRTSIYWAGYGTIQATLNGFGEIPLTNYDYINVISGQDFPLKSADHIYRYIDQRRDKEFITCDSIKDKWKEAAIRVTDYHLINWRIPGKFRLSRLITKILPPRKFPLDYELVGRANWFTLTPASITYLLDFLTKNPKVIRFFKYCWGADEFFFATILFNSHFKDHIVDNLVYVDWSVPVKTGHPKLLRSEDFEALCATDKLFARKFDIDTDAAIFDKLEAWIGLKA